METREASGENQYLIILKATTLYLQALQADQAGDWDKAHALIQDDPSSEAAWIHAYLHRKEGDGYNAGYWYRKADRPVCSTSLEEEWQQLWEYFGK